MKFTLSADSLSSWDSIYEEDQEKLSEVPEYIKKLASQGKWNFLLITGPRELSLDCNMISMAVTLLKLDFVLLLPCSCACWLWHRKSPWSWFIWSSRRCNTQSGQSAGKLKLKITSHFFTKSFWHQGSRSKTSHLIITELFYSRISIWTEILFIQGVSGM